MIERLNKQIALLEADAKRQARLKPAFRQLKTVAGIGEVLTLTIMLETGDIQRLAKPGQFPSYCRRVKGERRSNDGRCRVQMISRGTGGCQGPPSAARPQALIPMGDWCGRQAGP